MLAELLELIQAALTVLLFVCVSVVCIFGVVWLIVKVEDRWFS